MRKNSKEGKRGRGKGRKHERGRNEEIVRQGREGNEEGKKERKKREILYIPGDKGEDCLHEGNGGLDPTLPPASKYQRNHHWSGWTQNH